MLSTATASKKYTLEHLALPRKHKGWFIRQAASKTHALLAECFGSVQTVPQLREEFWSMPAAHVMWAQEKEGGAPIACVIVQEYAGGADGHKHAYKLRGVCVTPRWRGRGVGTDLVRFALERLSYADPSADVALTVDTDRASTEDLLEWYDSAFGFRTLWRDTEVRLADRYRTLYCSEDSEHVMLLRRSSSPTAVLDLTAAKEPVMMDLFE